MELTATIRVYALAATINTASLTAVITPGGLTANIQPANLTATLQVYNLTAQVTAGMQGEPGSAAEEIIAIAGENLSALTVVRAKTGGVFKCDSSNALDADTAIGITSSAAALGSNVRIRSFGAYANALWNWTMGIPIFLNSASALTQTPPAFGFVQQLAVPSSPTSIMINIKQSIKLI